MAIRTMMLAAALAATGTGGFAQPVTNVATIDRAATVTVAPSPSAAAARFIDIEVTAYTPPRDGAVQAIVLSSEGGKQVELGRFGIYGARFDTATGGTPQRFRLPLPAGVMPGQVVTIKLAPTNGSASGAAMVIGPSRLGN